MKKFHNLESSTCIFGEEKDSLVTKPLVNFSVLIFIHETKTIFYAELQKTQELR